VTVPLHHVRVDTDPLPEGYDDIPIVTAIIAVACIVLVGVVMLFTGTSWDDFEDPEALPPPACDQCVRTWWAR
jgi:hypothetical protein